MQDVRVGTEIVPGISVCGISASYNLVLLILLAFILSPFPHPIFPLSLIRFALHPTPLLSPLPQIVVSIPMLPSSRHDKINIPKVYSFASGLNDGFETKGECVGEGGLKKAHCNSTD